MVGGVACRALRPLEVEGDERDPSLQHEGDGSAVQRIAEGDVDTADVVRYRADGGEKEPFVGQDDSCLKVLRRLGDVQLLEERRESLGL